MERGLTWGERSRLEIAARLAESRPSGWRGAGEACDPHAFDPDDRALRWGATEPPLARLHREEKRRKLASRFHFPKSGKDQSSLLAVRSFRVDFPLGARPRVDVLGASHETAERLARLAHRHEAFFDLVRTEDLVAILVRPFDLIRGQDRRSLEVYPRFFDHVCALYARAGIEETLSTLRWIGSKAWRDEGDSRSFRRRRGPPRLTGGTGDASGLFAGSVSTRLDDSDLGSPVKLLQAFRDGRVHPEGSLPEVEAEALILLLRLAEAVHGGRDPGLALALSGGPGVLPRVLDFSGANLAGFLRTEPWARSVARLLEDALLGKRRVPVWARGVGPRDLQPIIRELDALAVMRQRHPSEAIHQAARFFPKISEMAMAQLGPRMENLIARLQKEPELRPPLDGPLPAVLLPDLLRRRPNVLRILRGQWFHTLPGLPTPLVKELDRCVIPALATTTVATFLSAAYQGREGRFADRRAAYDAAGVGGRPHRLLWITDTFHDHNGVSRFLSSFHREAVERDLPVDFLICSSERKAEPHLHVLEPRVESRLDDYPDQVFRIPDPLHVLRFAAEGGYTAVLTSTEGPFGASALWLKQALGLPAYLYMHTDWVDFARKTLGWTEDTLRAASAGLGRFYGAFDGVFTLNREHRKWLAGAEVGLEPMKIRKSAHWADAFFLPGPDERKARFGATDDESVFLYAGRLSDEKGVFDLVEVCEVLKARGAKFRLVIAGTGPAKERLEAALPEALLLGWVQPTELPAVYASADALLMPSRFDTFGCVVLEALSCGLPVLAYDAKGPADIIEHEKSGFLLESPRDLAESCLLLAGDPERRKTMRRNAIDRAKRFTREKIISDLLRDVGFPAQAIPEPPEHR